MIADHNWIRKQILKYFKKLVYKPYPSTTEQKQLEINNHHHQVERTLGAESLLASISSSLNWGETPCPKYFIQLLMQLN